MCLLRRADALGSTGHELFSMIRRKPRYVGKREEKPEGTK
jgi:hypothetical protein